MSPVRLKGFTLIEVLVALVILTIALSTLYKSFSSTVNATLYLQDKTGADFVGLNVIAGYELGQENASQGYENMLGTLWYWTATRSPTQNPAISRIAVEVRKNATSPAMIHLTGYSGNPES